jgi:hypothetical protein
MSTPPSVPPPASATAVPKVAPVSLAQSTGFSSDAAAPLDELTEKRLDTIEMIGEEEAAGFPTAGTSQVSAGMRYLHSSRTIHQLVTDRNRVVGLYLAVASLLYTASGAVLNARPGVRLMVPIELIQYWCLPVTFGILTALALFTGFLLIRTRIGLIYEVAKMNVLLGLPVGRVKRLGFLSIFFIMHLLVSLAGGGSGLLFAYHLLYRGEGSEGQALVASILVGMGVTVFLVLLYMVTVLYTTADDKLTGEDKAAGPPIR